MNNVFQSSNVLKDLKKKLSKEREEIRKAAMDSPKYNMNHPDQRFHDAIERSSAPKDNN